MRRDLFTTAVTENLDVNPSSATAMSAFYGTATSLNQHVHDCNFGRSRNIPDGLSSSTVLKNLPEAFTNVKPSYLPSKVSMRKLNLSGNAHVSDDSDLVQDCLNTDREWLEHVKAAQGSDPENLSWAAYHASQSTNEKQYPDSSALLPVWKDDSKSPAMIKHSLDIVMDAVAYLNTCSCI